MTRQEKLKKAKELKQQREVTHFLDASESLVKLLSNGVDVNLDDLVSQLGSIEELKDIVDDLNKTIAAFKLPEDVKVAGLESIVSAVKNITIPESKVSVDFADSKSIKQLTDILEKLVTATSNKIYVANTLPEDFVPVRRVRKVGNRLIFDDDTHTGSSGGGGGGGSQFVNSNGDVVNVELDGGSIPVFTTSTSTVDLTRVGGTVIDTSTGNASAGTQRVVLAEDQAALLRSKYALSDIDDSTSTEYYGYEAADGAWYIKKFASNSFTFVAGGSNYATAWAGRAGLSYDTYSGVF